MAYIFHYDAVNDARTNQLLYLMDGKATIPLEAKDHQVAKENGIAQTGSVTWTT
jgi:hypothetical protein